LFQKCSKSAEAIENREVISSLHLRTKTEERNKKSPGTHLESEALPAQATSPLPDKVDRNAISQLLADAHFRFLERIRKLKKQIPRFARDDN
jgi:hypothetical protein